MAVVDLHNQRVQQGESAQPNEHLIGRLRELLAEAESGHLQSFLGVGMCRDGWASYCSAGALELSGTTLCGHLHRLSVDFADRLNRNSQ